MRSLFTIALMKKSATDFMSSDDFLSLLRARGLEDMHVAALENEADKQAAYQALAGPLWPLMPEVAQDEKDYLIFATKLGDSSTHLLVTQRNTGYVKFRLINPDLSKLLQASEKLMWLLIGKEDDQGAKLTVADKRVEVLEKGENHVILEGRVLTDHFQEALSRNGKNFKLSVSTAGAFVVLTAALFVMDHFGMPHDGVVFGAVERISTVSVTTSVVSAFDFAQTYRGLKRHRIVAWRASTIEDYIGDFDVS